MKQPRKTPLDLHIEQKQAELRAAIDTFETADRLIERLKIEIDALMQARGAINAAAQKPQQPKSELSIVNGESVSETKRGRSISAAWKTVLKRIGDHVVFGASIDEILALCKAEGIKLKRPTLRAQLSNYVSKHNYLERTPSGTFTLTRKGALVAGYFGETRKEAEAPR